ncbi:MAG: calcium/sodium antiporter [Desulfobacteraceae bacterium]|nr:calcium/sodium antiporter [Desulfobacteraceae bacterium]
MMIQLALFMLGLLMLYFGADWLVKGASNLASSLGLTPMVIGLTVVAFGTSAPELVVSVVSSLKGKSMIAVGNVIGSNICNIALVLGLTAVFQPVITNIGVIRRDIPIMLGVSLYLLLISLNSTIGRVEGVTLFIGIIAYLCYNYLYAKRSTLSADTGTDKSTASGGRKHSYLRVTNTLLVITGIAIVVKGADVLIDAAVTIMKTFGVSDKFIGLTVVAFGTSLPELATSVVAAIKKEIDISLGNLVGSNVFNILCVLGMAAMVRPIPIPGGFLGSGLLVDYIVMMIISVLPWLMMRRDFTICRKEGGFLLLCYVGYIGYLIGS